MSEQTSDTGTASAIRILVPLDSSAEARTALPYAAALATPGTEIVLFSPTEELAVTDAAMQRNMKAMQAV